MENTEKPTQAGASIQERLETLLEPQQEASQPEIEPEVEASQPEPQEEVEASGDDAGKSEGAASVTDLAQYFGLDENAIDVDESGAVYFRTRIDGQEGKAKLQDLLSSYQLRGHVDNKAREVAEQQKAIQQKMAEANQFIQQRYQVAEDLAKAAQAQLVREFDGIDWQRLRNDNPGEYSALFTEFQQRQAQIQQALQGASSERQRAMHEQQQAYQQVVMQEAELLPKMIPEWSDEVVAKKERDEIRSWMESKGIPKEEINQVSKAVYVDLLRKAMLYERLQTSKPQIQNKIRIAPKLVKPGQSEDASQRAAAGVKQLKSNVKKSGSTASAIEYLLGTGKV